MQRPLRAGDFRAENEMLGALAPPQGPLSVRGHVDATTDDTEPLCVVEWNERGVTLPADGTVFRNRGFEHDLIECTCPYEIDAKTRYELGPDGVRCTVRMPISGARVGEDRADG